MNYITINNLVLQYKLSNPSRTLKNQIILNLIKEYGSLISSLINKAPKYQKSSIKNDFIFTLLIAIDSFNTSKGISFNTFFYSYVKGIIRQSINSSGYFKFQKSIVSEFESDDTLLESDYIIDIYKLLNDSEIIAYKLNFKKITSKNKLLQSAKIKVKNYLYNNKFPL